MGTTTWTKVGQWEGVVTHCKGVLTSFLPLQGGAPSPTESAATRQHAVRTPILHTGAPQPFPGIRGLEG